MYAIIMIAIFTIMIERFLAKRRNKIADKEYKKKYSTLNIDDQVKRLIQAIKILEQSRYSCENGQEIISLIERNASEVRIMNNENAVKAIAILRSQSKKEINSDEQLKMFLEFSKMTN